MITWHKMTGRFGNILYSIYTIFNYCRKFNIDFNNIKFGVQSSFTKIKDYYDYFINIHKYFIDETVYSEYMKKCQCGGLCNKCKLKKLNVYFNGYGIEYPRQHNEKKLFFDLFYNAKIYDDVKNKIDFDLSDKIAFHIRRTDFLLPQWNREENIESINSRLDKYPRERVIIYSDDILWCKKNIKNIYLYFDKSKYLLNDFQCHISMCLCKEVDVAPYSSFSETAKIINQIYKEENK